MTPSDDERTFRFLARVPSFSLIYFTGDVHEQIQTLLTSLGYSIVGQASDHGPFFQVLDGLGTDENRTIVHKAAYRVTGGTVLLDPEMVVGISRTEVVDRFCEEHEVEAIVAIWERYSETVIAARRSGQGPLVDAFFVRKRPQKLPMNAPPSLIEQPGPGSLRAFLAAAGAPVGELFGTISPVVYRLDESSMS
jgi:hypothetical protein